MKDVCYKRLFNGWVYLCKMVRRGNFIEIESGFLGLVGYGKIIEIRMVFSIYIIFFWSDEDFLVLMVV